MTEAVNQVFAGFILSVTSGLLAIALYSLVVNFVFGTPKRRGIIHYSDKTGCTSCSMGCLFYLLSVFMTLVVMVKFAPRVARHLTGLSATVSLGSRGQQSTLNQGSGGTHIYYTNIGYALGFIGLIFVLSFLKKMWGKRDKAQPNEEQT